ncbi:MAG: Helix-turn-helix domain [Solirubrobacterales bacterium]|nr:Helix-turn-helix domain [Solirubrobacterales bacterium]
MTESERNLVPSPALEPLLSIEEVSELLRISESGIYRLLRRSQLVSVKVGGRTLFEPGAIRAFIAASRRAGSAEGGSDIPDNKEAA